MSNRYLEKIAETKRTTNYSGPVPTITVQKMNKSPITYSAADYFTKVKPKEEALNAAEKAGIVGTSTGITFGLLTPGGWKDKVRSAARSIATGTTVGAGMTGVITYKQSQSKGKETLKFINSTYGAKQ